MFLSRKNDFSVVSSRLGKCDLETGNRKRSNNIFHSTLETPSRLRIIIEVSELCIVTECGCERGQFHWYSTSSNSSFKPYSSYVKCSISINLQWGERNFNTKSINIIETDYYYYYTSFTSFITSAWTQKNVTSWELSEVPYTIYTSCYETHDVSSNVIPPCLVMLGSKIVRRIGWVNTGERGPAEWIPLTYYWSGR